jgi:hypothetical protein
MLSVRGVTRAGVVAVALVLLAAGGGRPDGPAPSFFLGPQKKGLQGTVE